MSNVTVVSDEYTNIQEVAVKKIKVTKPNLGTMLDEGKNSRVAAPKVEEPVKVQEIEEVKPKVVEEPKNEEMPLYMNSREYKPKDIGFDETAIKEKIAENYKNLANFDKKPETKIEPVQKLNLNDKIAKFEKLLSTDVIIMQDKIEMFRKVFNEKNGKVQDAKAEQAKYADAFIKAKNEEQTARADKEVKETRTKQMNNKDHFVYLTVGENEDGEIVEAIRYVNESLKNLYNINQNLYKEAVAKIEKCEADKKEINKASEKVGTEIHKYVAELSKFIDDKTPLLEEIIKVNNQYKTMQKESDKAIKDEYEAITEEENAKIGINLNTESQDVVPNINQGMNAFENFKQAASEGGNEAAVGTYDNFMNDFGDMDVYGRAR